MMLKEKSLMKTENAFVALNLNLEGVTADKTILVEERHKVNFNPQEIYLSYLIIFSYEKLLLYLLFFFF